MSGCHTLGPEALAAYRSACTESLTDLNFQMIRQGEQAISKMRVSSAEALIMARLTCPAEGDGDSLSRDLDSYLVRAFQARVHIGSIHMAILQRAWAAAGPRGRAIVASSAGLTEQQGHPPIWA